ncbi:MAG: hypothetical protein IT366_01695 [Candidatus Hydrogenedentes bacterium]|nr:hypothetical protein [Candidatus Hydrogenedentota bacterium]
MNQTMTEDPSLSIGLEGDVPKESDDTGAQLTHRAEKVGQAATQTGKKIADYVSHKAHDATNTVGEGLKSLGDTVREKTPSGAATTAVADSLEHAGRYLQEEGLGGAAHDLTDLIRRNPIPALLVGIGFGFLIAQATASKRG